MEQPPAPTPPQYELSLEELYQIIGELEVVRRKQAQAIAALTKRLEPPSGPPEPQ